MSIAGIGMNSNIVASVMIVTMTATSANGAGGGCVYEPAVFNCYGYEPTDWWMIETMIGVGMLLLLGLVLVIVGVTRGRATLLAVKETRDYESQAISALNYNQVDRAISLGSTYASSPVAAVVTASLERSRYQAGETPVRLSKLEFQEAVVGQTEFLKRKLWVLSSIALSSPLIGLATMLVPPIYDAATTSPLCIGLLMAASAVWLHNWLSSETDLLLQKTHRVSLAIAEQIVDQTTAAIDNQKGHRALFGSCDRDSNSITISGSALPTPICKPSSSTQTI